MKKILLIVGNRPQFIKSSPLVRIFQKHGKYDFSILHTGQHYDSNMSKIFFDELDIPEPSVNLNITGTSHGKQTGLMLIEIEKYLLKNPPDCVMVFGDTNSTLAGALAASKLNLNLTHVEAGLRSRNMKMPEEINRIIADSVSSYLFCPTKRAVKNLISENAQGKIFNVGDLMYDALLLYKDKKAGHKFNLPSKYILCTIHRNYNTDNITRLKKIFELLSALENEIVFPLHPRTKKIVSESGIKIGANIKLTDPVSYIQMLNLLSGSEKVLTDSGGIQKEAYLLKKPCVTLRTETEWLETVETGWNVLADIDNQNVVDMIISFSPNTATYIEGAYGNGHAAELIHEHLLNNI